MSDKPLIAYVPAHLPSYYAKEHRVVERSSDMLETLAAQMDFELYTFPRSITNLDEATAAAADIARLNVDFTLLQAASFAMGDIVLPFADQNLRLGLWASEEPTKSGDILLNNLVAMNLHAGVLRRYLGINRFKWFYGMNDHPWFVERLNVTVTALRAMKALKGSRIGWFGGLAPSFLNMSFDPRRLRQHWRVEPESRDLTEIFERAKRQPDDLITTVVEEMRHAARGRLDISLKHARLSAAVYLAMREIAQTSDYDALAISDWPAFQEVLGLHPGMAFSWLHEKDRIPVASEGDVLGAMTLLLLEGACRQPAMLLDINDVDIEHGAMLMWHCGGSPLGFADEHGLRWINHSTLGRKDAAAQPTGAVADLRFRRGAVTVCRLVADGHELFCLDAEVVEHPESGFEGSRGWVGCFNVAGRKLSLSDVIHTIMTEGIDHHFALGAGHTATALRELAVWMELESIDIMSYSDGLESARPVT